MPSPPDRYLDRARQPLHALLFLLPLLAVYELGLILVIGETGGDIVARRMLERAFAVLGVEFSHGGLGTTVSLMPGLLVITMLLAWHLARGDPWQRPRPLLYLGMWGESLLLALPLVLLQAAFFRVPVAASAAEAGPESLSLEAALLFSLGAGLYEELVFRFLALGLLHLALSDLARLPAAWSAGLAVTLSSLAFAFYHFPALESLELTRFLAYFTAGLYFALIYLGRGLGIVVAVHALYDVLVVSWADLG